MEPTMTSSGAGGGEGGPGRVVRIDDGRIQAHLDEVVRGDGGRDAERAAGRGGRPSVRGAQVRAHGRPQDTRAGIYDRQLHTKAGEVSLQVPRLRSLPFETAIIERYRRRESSVEEALVEMYLAGVSVRRVEDITQALWGTRVQPQHGQRAEPEDLRQDRGVAQAADGGRVPVRVPGWPVAEAQLGRRGEERLGAGGHRRVADGYREILAVSEGAKEDKASWTNFLRDLKQRGLKGVSCSSPTSAWGWWRTWPTFIPRRSGSAAWCISIATC